MEQEPKDLKASEVCEMLNVSYAWLRRHLDEFEHYQIPGRGFSGKEFRFKAKSIQAFRERYRVGGD